MTGADIHLLLLSVAHPYGAHVGVGVTQIMTSYMSQIRELAEEKIQQQDSLACFLSTQQGGMPSNTGRLLLEDEEGITDDDDDEEGLGGKSG